MTTVRHIESEAIVSDDVTIKYNTVVLQLKSALVVGQGANGNTGRTGWVYVTGLTIAGGQTISEEVYQDAGNTVLQSATVSDSAFSFDVRGSFPLVEVYDVTNQLVTATELTRNVDEGHYEGLVALTGIVSGDYTVRLIDSDGNSAAEDSIAITVDLPPVIQALSFGGGYPGSQTELKENDSFQVSGVTSKAIDLVEIQDYEAGQFASIGVAPTTNFSVALTVADRGNIAVARPARVRVRDAVTGAFSTLRDTNQGGGTVDGVDLIVLNNIVPNIAFGVITYPGSQLALKNSENATIGFSSADLDTVLFDSPNGDLSITNPTLDEATKTVTRIAGLYNISTNNLRATANRLANDATTVVQLIVNVAHVAPLITINPATARVRSGVSPGADTTITISADQQLLSAPSVDPAASRGIFQGGGFVGGPTNWTRALRVTDAENPTDDSVNAWLNLLATNLAGIVTSIITTGPTYIVGGFTPRTINYAAFTANSSESFPLTSEAKLQAGAFSNGNSAVVQPFGTADTTDVGKEGWCAPTAASGSVSMRMLHSPSVGANSGGLTLTLVEETV